MRTTALLIILVCSSLTKVAISQEIFQVVKGSVSDADSRSPIPGATIIIQGSDPLIGTVSDNDGRFRLENVPLGRHTIVITFMGYETLTIPELVVGSGKEVVLDVSIREKATSLNAIDVVAADAKDDGMGRMAQSGVNRLNVEQANRYAGAADDPSRLASSFAGVASGLTSNGIVIRGNPAKGLLWRLEDVEITNPNHYADLTVFGAGGLCALSSQMLANSDFYTGAFTAEYSNALSGVFDMKLRSGNPDKREYAFGLSSNGIDVSSEGPFKKGGRATYLFNYRFSTLTLLQPILPPEAGKLNYQDLSWKINIPGKKCIWSFWGFGARDSQHHDAVADSTERELESDALQYDSRMFSSASGLNYRLQLNSSAFFSSVLSYSGYGVQLTQSAFSADNIFHDEYNIKSLNQRISNRTYVQKKFSARHSNKSGFSVSGNSYLVRVQQAFSDTTALQSTIDGKGHSMQFTAFSQSKISLSDRVSFVAGINAVYNNLNEDILIEPRISSRIECGALSSVSLAAGLYSRSEPLNVYFIQDSSGACPNRSLPATKAFHLVAGYERVLSENLRLKIEPYYQYLYDVPVGINNNFSMINAEAVYLLNEPLKPGGTGQNIGIDFTLERALKGKYYYLMTASLFDSRYTSASGKEFNTRFNKHYVVNLLGGYEWKVGRNKKNLLNLNLRLCFMGGDRTETVDYAVSMATQQVIFDDSKIFETKKPDAQIVSIALNYRINKRKHASVWSIQMINVLGEKDYEYCEWDEHSGTVRMKADPYIIPAISYKIEW